MVGVRTKLLAPAVAVALAAVGCGDGPAPPEVVPVAEASTVPFEGSGLTAPTTPVPTSSPEPTPTPSPTPSASPTAAPSPTPAGPAGPSTADAAAFIAADDPEGVEGLDHVVVDLDGDNIDEVLATGISEDAGWVRIAQWDGVAYRSGATERAGPGSSVADVRVGDVNADGVREVLVTVTGDGRRSIALWGVGDLGSLEPLEAVGGCNDGSHVYGVTRARLEQSGEDPVVVVADCDESPLPVAEWAEQRWAWSDGAYRHQPPAPPTPEGDPEAGEADGPGNANGNGNDQGNGNGNGGRPDDGDGDGDGD